MNVKKIRNSIIFWIYVLVGCLFLAEPCHAPPPFSCDISCGDVTGDHFVNARDFMFVLAEYGQLSSGETLSCVEGLFSDDGYADLYDLMGWDWADYLVSEKNISSLCFDCSYGFSVPIVPCGSTTSSSSAAFSPQTASAPSPLLEGALLIGGKIYNPVAEDFLSDRLYGFDEDYSFIDGPFAMNNDRLNGRLVRDQVGELYQLNLEEGLVRLSDQNSVIPRDNGFSVGSEPRYGGPATVHVGFQDDLEDTWGRPVLDAAFDSQGYVYVTPVVVEPDVNEPYVASAKLELAPNDVPPYHVLEIYDDPPEPNDNQDPNNLWEIEVDGNGNVYTTSKSFLNSGDILRVYDNNGVMINKCELQNLGIYGPIGLCCSSYDSSRLYLASSLSATDATSTMIYGLATDDLSLVRSITIHGMGHVTGITEDPTTGALWVVGFTMPVYIDFLPGLPDMPQFYHPYTAKIPPDSNVAQAECLRTSDCAGDDLGLPTSIVWTGVSSGGGPDRVIYVDANATGDANGLNWTNAYNYLQDALADPCLALGDDIWVAEGIYKPDQGTGKTPGDRDATLQLKNGVGIYGGFPSSGDPNFNDRNPNSYETVLSGEIGSPASSDNSYHIVTAAGTWLASVLDGFTVTGGNAANNGGGGILIYDGRATISNCIISGNSASFGGGIYCHSNDDTYCRSGMRLVDCNIIGNSPDDIRMESGPVEIVGTVQLASNDWVGNDLFLYGDGTLQIDSDVTLYLDNSTIRCNISGPGNIVVALGYELIIEGTADVNLAHETDPNQNGEIQCDGLLLVRDSVHLSNANIQVSRASFEGDVDISNSVITAEAGAPYGQFFIEDTVHITGNDIHADGDRYMDLDPSVFAGLIANNRIYVTITEGVGQARGGLLELRGEDGLAVPPCGPNEFFCQVDNVPAFDTNSWAIEQLELIAGAKVNLTNRFDFGNGGLYEVMYVKDLVLGPDSVLNTAFNQLYYENLSGDPNSVINKPLLGFSLSNIALDNDNEFITRVIHNNYTHPEDPNYDRTHVERVDGNAPDPNGMMRMCNLLDLDPCSSYYNQVINARAKGLFAKASEDEIVILFEYLFGTSDPNAVLVVYLSDVPELLDANDPCRAAHYIEVARLYPPPAGRYGSEGSDHFGVFEKTVFAENLNFIRGVRMELELVGPEGTCILIDDWDPFVACTVSCGDVTGDHLITTKDFLTVLGEYGKLSGYDGCLNGMFSNDGYVNTTDLLGGDWADYLVSEKITTLCFDCQDGFGVPIVPCGSTISSSSTALTPAAPLPLTAGPAGFEGTLLIAGKRYNSNEQDFLSDRLYGFDEDCNFISGPFAMDNDRLNGKLVRDHEGKLYQLNLEKGLVRLSDGNSVIPRGQGFPVDSEPRYNESATIYVGLQDNLEYTWGRPVLDAAFDSQGYVYVTPVVVEPDVNEPYVASARLELAPNDVPPYHVLKIYDDPPEPNDNQDPNNLCEIEVDDQGDVYIISNYHINNSDILRVYNSNGDVNRCELQNLGIFAPIGLCCSSYYNSRLYLASSRNDPNANSISLHVLSTDDLTLVQTIDINGMGHITDITEDPTTGTVWVIGFTLAEDVTHRTYVFPSRIDQFYEPYLAEIPYGSSGPVQAISLSDANDLALPMSIVWTGTVVPEEKCGGADLDESGDVSLPDFAILAWYWRDVNCAGSNDCDGADLEPEASPDGDVDIKDVAVFALHWLETGCTSP